MTQAELVLHIEFLQLKAEEEAKALEDSKSGSGGQRMEKVSPRQIMSELKR